jgi:hypothetical protein
MCSNIIVSYVGNIAKCCAISHIGRNVAYMKYKYGTILLINYLSMLHVLGPHTILYLVSIRTSNMKNIINIKNCVHTLECFDKDMVDSVLYGKACEYIVLSILVCFYYMLC